MYIYANHLAKMKTGMHVSAGISLIYRPKAVKTAVFYPPLCTTSVQSIKVCDSDPMLHSPDSLLYEMHPFPPVSTY